MAIEARLGFPSHYRLSSPLRLPHLKFLFVLSNKLLYVVGNAFVAGDTDCLWVKSKAAVS